MARKTTWVLVADGARAHVYASENEALIPALDHDIAASTRARSSEIGSDRPGRTFDRFGPGRHAMEPPTDWKTHERQLLARAVAEELGEAARNNAFHQLVVVAPPEMLGDLRDAFGKSLVRLVSAEIAKDLTHVPVHDLPRHLGETLGH